MAIRAHRKYKANRYSPFNRNGKCKRNFTVQEETAFEKFLRQNNLTQKSVIRSVAGKTWIKKHFRNHYIPEEILTTLGISEDVVVSVGGLSSLIHER